MEWISVKENLPKHMQECRVYIENPFFGNFERNQNAVFLHFNDMENGEFYDSEEQIHLDFVSKWKPKEEE